MGTPAFFPRFALKASPTSPSESRPLSRGSKYVRFGFVIVNPSCRGKGYGKEMLLLAIQYVKEHLTATRIDLGVFENNDRAKHCYEAVGFREYNQRKCEMPIGVWECIDMELFLK